MCTDSGTEYYDYNGKRKKIMDNKLKEIDAKLSDFSDTLFDIKEEMQDSITIKDVTDEEIDALFDN